MRILTWNLNRRGPESLEGIRELNADVILLQEVTVGSAIRIVAALSRFGFHSHADGASILGGSMGDGNITAIAGPCRWRRETGHRRCPFRS